LRDEIVTETIAVPDDFAERYLSPYGSGFSLEPILTQSAWFRPHNRSDAAENLYLVGAGTHPGAGLPGVISSARMLDRMVPDAVAFKR
jgi:phytoene desaturase